MFNWMKNIGTKIGNLGDSGRVSIKANKTTRVTINGIQVEGKGIEINGGKLFVDGKEHESQLGYLITINVSGDVDTIETSTGDINCRDVKGSIKASTGDVHCGNVTGNVQTDVGDITAENVGGYIKTNVGDIQCGDVGGNVQTETGDIYASNISGKASTDLGDIRTSK